MQARRALQPAARCLGLGGPGADAAAAAPRALSGCLASGVDSWPHRRCRFLSTAEKPEATPKPSASTSTPRHLRPWERPLLAEVYRQVRGQHLEGREASSPPAAGSPLGGGAGVSVPGWEYTPEDERGLRFGSAYMLLTLAWNRKFTRLKELLVNANRSREGAKQVLLRVINVLATDLPGSNKAEASAEGLGLVSEEGGSEGEPGEEESAAAKTEGSGSTSAGGASQHVHAESLLGRLHGCLGPQLQQLLQQQAAFLAQRGLTLHAVVRPQRVAVDVIYGIVAVLLQHGSLQVLLRRGGSSSSSSLGAPATLYMAKPRTFDFEAAAAAAEAALQGPGQDEGADRMASEGGDQEKGNKRYDPGPEDIPLSAVEKRLHLLNVESIWRKRARERMQVFLKQPLTFRQFMNMCADCGSALDRGFVVVADFKILCSQQIAILDHQGNIVMGSKDDEPAVHTLRLELNAKFDPGNS
ncbi:hypothetical protein ACSSS7_002721 [Eimeria intestinalis]